MKPLRTRWGRKLTLGYRDVQPWLWSNFREGFVNRLPYAYFIFPEEAYTYTRGHGLRIREARLTSVLLRLSLEPYWMSTSLRGADGKVRLRGAAVSLAIGLQR